MKDLGDLGFLDQSQIFKTYGKREFMEKIVKLENVKKETFGETPKLHTFIKRQF